MLKIISCETFKEAWRTLEQCFETKTTHEAQSLYRRMASMKINSAAEISAGVSEVKCIIAKLADFDEKMSDNYLIVTLLEALPSSFDFFQVVWRNEAEQNLDAFVKKLMAEAKVQITREQTEAVALAAKTKREGQKLGKDQCRYCKEKGHWLRDCPNLKTPYDPYRMKKKDQKDQDTDTQSSNDKGKREELAFMTRAHNMNERSQEDIWVADSGCTHHMPHTSSCLST